jgi:hypothetical protein
MRNAVIVDKVNAYLNGPGAPISAAILEDVGQIAVQAFSRQFGARSEDAGQLRLSGIGRCVRQQAYRILNFPAQGKEIDARSKMVFFQGDLVELAVIQVARQAGCDITATGMTQGLVQLDGVYGHPDGVLHSPNEDVLVEIKSMSSYGFAEFERGVIDPAYEAQYNAYLEATGLDRVCLVGLNKDAGVLHEQIRTKDPTIVADVKKRITTIKAATPESLPLRPYGPNDKGFYPWQCLYCAFHRLCLPEAEKVVVGKAYKLKTGKKGTA